MTRLNTLQKTSLAERFGDRVTFQKTERRLYGHDIAAMPGLVKPIIGSTVPEAVVQPETEDELVDLVNWARREHVALTPRGMATSGYGGVLPVKHGVVVDFHRMNEVSKVDVGNQTVTVQPGVIWERLDNDLQKHGLTLRLYPTSYPASTVGGWLAQGGAGIGSYEMGWFRDNVTSARVVQPDGTVRDFSGCDLDLVSDAEGTTGLIGSVSLRVQPNEPVESRAVAAGNAGDLQEVVEWIIEAKLPLWSMLFINPRMAALRNRLPVAHPHHGTPEERVVLPEKYILTLTYRIRDRVLMSEALTRLAERPGVEMLPDAIATHEWENRFKLLMVKRLGPSLVPSEIVVPLSRLGAAMTEIESKIHQPVVKEGIVVRNGRDGKPEVVLLGFIPSDERKFSYNFIFALSLSIFKIAERHGGRAYATGLYFTGKAKGVLGADRIARLAALKVKTDPANILNPGKVIGMNLAARFVSLAVKVEPLIRPLGNRAVALIGERPTRALRGIPADVAWHAYACSQCGYCVSECDQFYGRGWESQSPRGKWYWLRQYLEGREKMDQSVVDSFIACTTCELCDNRCGIGLPIEASWMKLRGALIHDQGRMTFPPFEMMSAALRKEGNIWAGYRKDRTAWFPDDLKSKHGPEHKAKAVYFAGCTASYVEHDIAMASVRLLDAAKVDFTYLAGKENCCGTPMLASGKWDVFAEVVKANVKAVHDAGADTVITSCPACDMMWRTVYPQWARKLGIDFNITTRNYTEVAAGQLKNGALVFPNNGHKPCTVTWHDSCHMGRATGVYEPPRELIQALPGVTLVEMEHNRESAHCCGSVLTMMKDPPVAAIVGKVRLDEVVEVGAGKVLALCPCCEFQLRVSADKTNSDIEVVDLARFLASYLGYEFPDPNPEVLRQWAVFEAMIALMTPAGFADLMGSMWPELINAMPFGMGPMMRAMGKIPGALDMMKPMFPVLFPRLLPMMMPKVMPAMLKRVAERIPMPDYMAEQMPELMPKVMDNLMPHMIGDVVPLITQPMIDYLKGRVQAG